MKTNLDDTFDRLEKTLDDGIKSFQKMEIKTDQLHVMVKKRNSLILLIPFMFLILFPILLWFSMKLLGLI